MPRRNRPQKRRSRMVLEVEVVKPPTTEQLARQLVHAGLASLLILGPMQAPGLMPSEEGETS